MDRFHEYDENVFRKAVQFVELQCLFLMLFSNLTKFALFVEYCLRMPYHQNDEHFWGDFVDCMSAKHFITAYNGADMTLPEKEAVIRHIDSCPACREYLSREEMMSGLLENGRKSPGLSKNVRTLLVIAAFLLLVTVPLVMTGMSRRELVSVRQDFLGEFIVLWKEGNRETISERMTSEAYEKFLILTEGEPVSKVTAMTFKEFRNLHGVEGAAVFRTSGELLGNREFNLTYTVGSWDGNILIVDVEGS